MGASSSSPTDSASSMPLKPPETILIHMKQEKDNNDEDNNDNEEGEDDDDEDEKPTKHDNTMESFSNRLWDQKRTALGGVRDKAYRKLTKAPSIDEESALLMERKIQRYDARMQDIQYQEDRWYRECALYMNYFQHEQMSMVWNTIGYWIFQGLLLCVAIKMSNRPGIILVSSSIVVLEHLYLGSFRSINITNDLEISKTHGNSPIQEIVPSES